MDTAGIRDAFGAVRPCPAHATPTCAGTTATAVFSAASLRANRRLTEKPGPAWFAATLERALTRSVHAAWQNGALFAFWPLPTQSTSAFPGLLAVPLAGQTIGGADRFRAEHAFPSWIARALEAHVAAAMLTSWQSYTLVAKLAVETQFAATLAWSTAVTLKRVASFSTDRYVAQIACPSW